MEKKGKLILCATPIGNLKDMTFRAVETLQNADLIAAEDTRNSLKLLNHFEIKTPLTSYHEHNKFEKAKELINKIHSGVTIALITDAGTPGISDPGEELVSMCIEEGIEVTAIPGAAACINALIISGLPTRRFCFEAFLPPSKKQRKKILEELSKETRTIIIYEAPHHLKSTLKELGEVLGTDRKISLVKELTKIHENVFITTIGNAIAHFESEAPRGEYVLVIKGKDLKEIEEENKSRWENMTIDEHMLHYLSSGMDKKDAMKAVAKDRGVAKNIIYKELNAD